MRQTGMSAPVVLAAMLGVAVPAARLARAQGQAPPPRSMALGHSVAVIGPNSPIFEGLLEKDFPGVSQVDYYQQIEPLLAVVHNNTRRVVKAYVVKWVITNADGSTATEYLPVMSEPAPGQAQLSGQRAVLEPGGSGFETELVSPYFHWPQRMFQGLLQVNAVRTNFQAASRELLASNIQSATRIQTTLDGAIFDDGVFVGPDTSGLYERFQARQQAQVDEAAWMLNQFSASPTDQQLKDALSEHIYQGRNSTGTDPASLYTAARGEEASWLLSLLEDDGQAALRHVAANLATAHRLTLRRGTSR